MEKQEDASLYPGLGIASTAEGFAAISMQRSLKFK